MKSKRTAFSLLVILLIIIVLLFPNVGYTQDGENTFRPGEIKQDGMGFEMVYIPRTIFEVGISYDKLRAVCNNMGENDTERCIQIIEEDTGATFTQTVEIPSFWIDRYEVTVEQFKNICQKIEASPANHYFMLNISCDQIFSVSDFEQGPQHPQLGVTWDVAFTFCNYRGARLSTEAEWEYTASGPEKRIFPWGDSLIEEYTHLPDESYPSLKTYPVGSISGNQSWIGVYDMAGNAAEWVEDRFLPRVLSNVELQELPSFYYGLETSRVIRGGSWDGRRWPMTTFYREAEQPDTINPHIGFRCARSTPPSED
jgi:formylglycine-generating enzyme required for sulfatase activity